MKAGEPAKRVAAMGLSLRPVYCGNIAELRREGSEGIEEAEIGEKAAEGREEEREMVSDSRIVAIEAEDRSSTGREKVDLKRRV